MMPARETRRERQLFVQRLEDRSTAERTRIMKEHAALLAVAPHAKAPIGKDASCLRAQRQLVSNQRRAVAVKTLAGSGKKRLAARNDVIDDEDDYDPELDDEAENSDEQDEDAAAIPSKGKAPARTLPPPPKKEKVTKASTHPRSHENQVRRELPLLNCVVTRLEMLRKEEASHLKRLGRDWR
ncbi:hypothetical protein PI124_g11457 [Phytophthora idaei]|nr:hypothetical protein PI124_g11457 [Phytophthora idaei]